MVKTPRPRYTLLTATIVLLFAVGALNIDHNKSRSTPVAVGVSSDSHARSPRWPKVRLAHLSMFPQCEACGGTNDLQVHHVKAFHCDERLELDPSNLITLCTDGPCNLNCHFVIGHAGNTKTNNPNVREDAARMFRLLHSGVDCELPQ